MPALPWAAASLLIVGVLFLAGGAVLIAVPLRRSRFAEGGRRTSVGSA